MMTISEIQKLLNSTFHVKDLGQLIYFLRLKVHCRSQGIFFFFLSKQVYSGFGLISMTLKYHYIDTPMKNMKYQCDEGGDS
jgi:hypothetical protein